MESEVYNQSFSLILKAAYFYYVKDMPQSQIAEALNISIPTVSRLIKKSKEEKIVEFVIRDPYIECVELEEKIKNRFGLKEVIIAPGPITSESTKINTIENMKKLVALEGARYIQRRIIPDDVLGITWGGTVYNLIHYLNPCQKIEAEFVTLHGSISHCDSELDVRTLVSRMAMAFGGRKYYLLTEGLMSKTNLADSIKKEKNIAKVFQMFNKVTIAINGLGSFYPKPDSMLSRTEYLSPSELDKLKSKNVFGDIALRFFDSEGRECDTDLKDRTIAIGFDEFKKIKTKVTIASGEHKTHTVLAAIKGDLVDVLIADYFLANSLLKLADK